MLNHDFVRGNLFPVYQAKLINPICELRYIQRLGHVAGYRFRKQFPAMEISQYQVAVAGKTIKLNNQFIVCGIRIYIK